MEKKIKGFLPVCVTFLVVCFFGTYLFSNTGCDGSMAVLENQKKINSEKSTKVYYDTQGGSEIGYKTMAAKDYFQDPANGNPTRKGYIFMGWFYDAACTQPCDYNKPVGASSFTVYAKWVEAVPDEKAEAGTVIDSDASPRTYDSFRQQNTSYVPTSAIKGTPVTLKKNKDIDLYPIWEPDPYSYTYRVTFENNNGGISSDYSVSVNSGALVPPPTDPTYPGYKLLGWYYGGDFENKWNFPKDSPTKDITLRALWEMESTIILVLNEGVMDGPNTIKVNPYDFSYTDLPIPTRAGYVFEGWSTDVNGIPLVNDTFKPTWDNKKDVYSTTLYAIWLPE